MKMLKKIRVGMPMEAMRSPKPREVGSIPTRRAISYGSSAGRAAHL